MDKAAIATMLRIPAPVRRIGTMPRRIRIGTLACVLPVTTMELTCKYLQGVVCRPEKWSAITTRLGEYI